MMKFKVVLQKKPNIDLHLRAENSDLVQVLFRTATDVELICEETILICGKKTEIKVYYIVTQRSRRKNLLILIGDKAVVFYDLWK